jgi:hypothetical protein
MSEYIIQIGNEVRDMTEDEILPNLDLLTTK